MAETSIEWCLGFEGRVGRTWNPTTGCDKISPGCGLPRFEGDDTGGCYALAMAGRLKAMGQPKYQADGDPRTSGPGFALTMHPDALGIPLRWRKPSLVFVNSMSDLGHARVTREFAAQVWAVMAVTPQHVYQVLSKRPERMRRLLADECACGKGHVPGIHLRSEMSWAAARNNPDQVAGMPDDAARRVYYDAGWPLRNVWMGTSIELDRYARRADELRATPAAVRFLSLEPLLGPLPSLDTTGIDWVLIGGESGPRAREMDLGWVRDIIARCRETGTAVFVKQMGRRWTEGHGGRGKGGDMAAWPEDLRIREFPAAAAGRDA